MKLQVVNLELYQNALQVCKCYNTSIKVKLQNKNRNGQKMDKLSKKLGSLQGIACKYQSLM